MAFPSMNRSKKLAKLMGPDSGSYASAPITGTPEPYAGWLGKCTLKLPTQSTSSLGNLVMSFRSTLKASSTELGLSRTNADRFFRLNPLSTLVPGAVVWWLSYHDSDSINAQERWGCSVNDIIRISRVLPAHNLQQQGYAFSLFTQQRDFQLTAPSQSVMDAWIYHIELARSATRKAISEATAEKSFFPHHQSSPNLLNQDDSEPESNHSSSQGSEVKLDHGPQPIITQLEPAKPVQEQHKPVIAKQQDLRRSISVNEMGTKLKPVQRKKSVLVQPTTVVSPTSDTTSSKLSGIASALDQSMTALKMLSLSNTELVDNINQLKSPQTPKSAAKCTHSASKLAFNAEKSSSANSLSNSLSSLSSKSSSTTSITKKLFASAAVKQSSAASLTNKSSAASLTTKSSTVSLNDTPAVGHVANLIAMMAGQISAVPAIPKNADLVVKSSTPSKTISQNSVDARSAASKLDKPQTSDTVNSKSVSLPLLKDGPSSASNSPKTMRNTIFNPNKGPNLGNLPIPPNGPKSIDANVIPPLNPKPAQVPPPQPQLPVKNSSVHVSQLGTGNVHVTQLGTADPALKSAPQFSINLLKSSPSLSRLMQFCKDEKESKVDFSGSTTNMPKPRPMATVLPLPPSSQQAVQATAPVSQAMTQSFNTPAAVTEPITVVETQVLNNQNIDTCVSAVNPTVSTLPETDSALSVDTAVLIRSPRNEMPIVNTLNLLRNSSILVHKPRPRMTIPASPLPSMLPVNSCVPTNSVPEIPTLPNPVVQPVVLDSFTSIKSIPKPNLPVPSVPDLAIQPVTVNTCKSTNLISESNSVAENHVSQNDTKMVDKPAEVIAFQPSQSLLEQVYAPCANSNESAYILKGTDIQDSVKLSMNTVQSNSVEAKQEMTISKLQTHDVKLLQEEQGSVANAPNLVQVLIDDSIDFEQVNPVYLTRTRRSVVASLKAILPPPPPLPPLTEPESKEHATESDASRDDEDLCAEQRLRTDTKLTRSIVATNSSETKQKRKTMAFELNDLDWGVQKVYDQNQSKNVIANVSDQPDSSIKLDPSSGQIEPLDIQCDKKINGNDRQPDSGLQV